MQAYMKSTMPCLGVQSRGQKAVFSAALAASPLPDRPSWEAAVAQLWDGAAYREERYGALAVSGHRRYAGYQDPAAIPMYERLVTEGAWWDYVDLLAVHRVGPILRAYPDRLRPAVVAWSRSPDRWLRRTAVICQVGAKSEVDAELLEECIGANLDDPDFFLRKGIGWALRQHARVDPDWVRGFVEANRDRLSPLSRREALRHLG
jgi:3-methyladenine DNA glycosylase AlkD